MVSLAPKGGKSIVSGPDLPPLYWKTVSQLFSDSVAKYGDKEAVIFCEQNVRLTYKELQLAVDKAAAGLLSIGLKKGDRVGIWSPNRIEWIITQFATARIGLILVNINPAYRLSELEFALNKVGCKAIIVANQFKTSNYQEMIQEIAPEINNCAPGRLRAAKLKELRVVVMMDENNLSGAFSFEQLATLGHNIGHSELDEIENSLIPDDAINIQFTSGTTGRPKGATLSHHNITNNARFVTDRICLTEHDRLAIPVPLYHCFGMVMGVLGAVDKGATMVFPNDSFNPKRTIETLEQESCSAIYGVPTMFVAMVEELKQHPRNLKHMRTGIISGAPCPYELMRRVNSEMNMSEVTICYGMTETSPVSFHCFVNDPIEKRCQTVGQILPHLEVKIVDENNEIVPVGSQGELCTKGYSVMKGYWNDEEQSRIVIQKGWMHTGDLAKFDEEGYCSIVGRVKDMIIRGGENVYPREIEELIIQHPEVKDVQVFGIPDNKYGEIVCAWVISRASQSLTEDDLKEFVHTHLSHYKIPSHIRFVKAFPLTVTGKPQKFIMRKQMSDWLQSS